MANLLDQASIVLTPTAYDNGKVLCAKPSEAPYGDFDFSRNSAATRVNAQGLVENVQILSSNLVQNGDFSEEGVQEVSNGSFSQEGVEQISNGNFDTDTNWTLSSGITYNSNGYLDFNLSSGQARNTPNTAFVQGKTYKVVYEIKNYVSGAIKFRFQSGINSIGQQQSGNGVKTEYIVCKDSSNNNFQFFGASSFIGSIDNVSVREVGQDWDLAANWSIAEDKAVSNGASGNLYQSGIIVTGKQYKIQATVSDYVSGNVEVSAGAVPRGTMSANGTYTFYQTASSTSNFFVVSNSFNGSITNISVKEVGMDWVFSSGAFITDIGARLTHTPTAGTLTSVGYSPLVIGNNYKMTYEITESISGGIKLNSAVVNTMVSTIGIHTKYFEATGNSISFARTDPSGNDVTIDNISVIEITDDTNLPRINYEGFSYQDALGSEEIVNGDFSNGTNNWTPNANATLTIDNNKLKVTISGASGYPSQFVTTEIGKTYKVTADAFIGTSSRLALYNDADGQFRNLYADGSFDFNITATSTSTQLRLYVFDDGSYALWDNVSVKEYLGQEVVPNSGCGSWLFEPQTTNLITYSEDFSQWANSSATVNFEESVINPSGNLGTYKLIPNTPLQAFHFISLSISPSSSSSVFAKKGEYNYLRLSNPSSGSGGVIFDLVNGTTNEIGTDITSSKMTDFGNGWWRCESVNSNVAGGTYSLHAQPIDTDGAYQGDGTSGVYIWGANATNDQDYATSYIPTSGSQVTRNQDVCTNGATGTGLINSTEGVLYAEIAALSDDGTFKFISLNTNASNRLRLGYSSTTNKISVLIQVDGAVKFNNSQIGNINQVDFNKIAVSYSASGVKVFVNGVEVNSNTVNSSFALLNKLDFRDGDTLNPFFGKTKAVAVFPYLTDQELTELTTI